MCLDRSVVEIKYVCSRQCIGIFVNGVVAYSTVGTYP